jgi:ABC-2 type transport system ATP-binding protein
MKLVIRSRNLSDGREGAVMDDSAAVVISGLTKSYGSVAAVAGVDLCISYGQVFALLGPNGAGKTTIMEILEGYRQRDAGEIAVLGLDPGRQREKLKPRIGIVLQSTGVDQYLTVAETVAMYSSYYPHPRPVDELIDLVGLTDKRKSRVVKLSGGQQRRLDVAIALAGDPELLFLDEPTTGFDPSARHEAWQVVKNLSAFGKTVLLTTHYMDEAQHLADRVAVIAAGRIVAEGPPAGLGGRDMAHARVRFRLPDGAELPASVTVEAIDDGWVETTPVNLAEALYRLSGWAIEQGFDLDDLEILRPSLEDVYLQLTSGQVTAGASMESRP